FELDKGTKGHITKEDAAGGRWPLTEAFERIDADADGQVTEVELRQSTDRTAAKLPNLAIPEMNGIGAQEICVTTAMGVCDFISAMDTDRVPEWNCWYHILNCGFPLKVSGETDFPCISGSRVGMGRVYVQLGKVESIDFGKWCDGLAKGRSYVSDGYAHALKFEVNGVAPGFGEVKLDTPGKAAVKTTVAFASEVSLGTAVGGRVAPAQSRKLELVVNGRVVETKDVPADDRPHDVEFSVPVERSSWVAVRSFPQMHTNPVNVLVGGKPIRASADSAKWCVGVIEQLWKVREKDIRPGERAEAKKTFDKALNIYQAIAKEAAGR
ncbi:MAG: CehA/McbA family metallohydrolase, partial [Gemmataceae bacterium]